MIQLRTNGKVGQKKGFYKTHLCFLKICLMREYTILLYIFNPPSPANQSILFKQMNILSFEIQDNFEKGEQEVHILITGDLQHCVLKLSQKL